MRLLCRPLQRDSGSLRLPLPGEVGLEILYQPQGTWFPNHSKSGFVLFCLSFSLSQALFPVSQAGRFSSSTLHILAPAPTVFPTPAASQPVREGLQSCRRTCGGIRGDNPSQPRAGGGSWRSLGYWGVGHLGAHPTCRSLNPIPACPAEPVPVPKLLPRRSEGKELAGGLEEPGQGMLTDMPGMA